MNILELNKTYSNGELSTAHGDKQIRYEVLSPLFENLFENKAVYHERVTSLIRLEDIILTPDLFNATAVRLKLFESKSNSLIPLSSIDSWSFGVNWAYLTLDSKGCLHPYSSWLMWVDPELVKIVDELVNENNYKEARKLTINNW